MKRNVLFLAIAFLPYLLICKHVQGRCTLPSFESRNVISSDYYPPTQSFPDGSILKFECFIGHKPVNSRASNSVTCVENNWTNLELRCETVKCEAPPFIENGRLRGEPLESYEYLQVVTYTCNRGFGLSGKSTLHCSEDGTFKPDPPKCVDECPTPQIPNSVRIGGRAPPYKLSHFIEYSCIKDHVLMGAKEITCTADGWSPEPPKCIGPCSVPDFGRSVTLTDEFRSKIKFPHGSKVKFKCSSGYEAVGSTAHQNSVTCEETKWTKLLLICKEKSCGIPSGFPNGRYETTGILFGDTITAVCNTGYMLDGFINVRQCQDGGWDGGDPVCEVVRCETPPSIENGYLHDEPLESYDFLQAVTYRCNRGFSLSGKSTLHCSEDGTFKPDPPKCVDGCPTPQIPNSVRIGGRAPPYKLDHFIEYSCIKDHVLMGAKEITCTADGWSPEPPKCIGPCSVPDFGRSVTLTDEFHYKIKFAHGSKVTFKCSSGYEAVDSTAHQNSVTCEETKWTKLLLICKAQDTQPLSESRNASDVLSTIIFHLRAWLRN